MPEAVQQFSFAAGELTPGLYGRVDLAHYQIGLRIARNFFVNYHGGVSNRPGLRFIAAANDETAPVRVVRFQFSTEQTYCLEFGDQYMRVIRDGALILSGGSPYVLTTPYAAADLFELQFTQSADVVTITHPGYAQRELARLADDNWTLSTISISPSVDPPANVSAAPGRAPGTAPGTPTPTGTAAPGDPAYKVAAFDSNGMSEPSQTAYLAAPTDSLSWASVSGASGYAVYKDVVGVFVLVGLTTATSWTPDTDVDIPAGPVSEASTGNNDDALQFTYKVTAISDTDGDESEASSEASCSGQTPTTKDPNVVGWDAVTGAAEYKVYKSRNGVFGYIGTSATTTFEDNNITPDISRTPPIDNNPFPGAGDFPATASYYQERLVYAGSDNNPQTMWGSQSGAYDNFAASSPPADADSFQFTIASREVNRIRHLLPMTELLALTSGGVWLVRGASDEVLTPTNVDVKPQSGHGIGTIPPLLIGDSALYIERGHRRVRDLGYSLEKDGFIGNDLTIRSSHLFKGARLVDWAWANDPYSIVWAVRDDGVLLSFTYLPEQQVWGWTRHETTGYVESVTTVEEDGEDAVYVVVRREVDGATRRYVERLETREFTDIVDAFFVDSGLSYDGRNTTSTTVTLTGGSPWEYFSTLTLTRSAGAWDADMSGKEVVLRTADGETKVRLTVLSRDSDTQLTVRAERDVPAELQDTATSSWGVAVSSVAGLSHLEGETITMLADGNVLADQVVSGGEATLSRAAEVIHAGLPYTCDIQTLDLALSGSQQTARHRYKLTGRAYIYVQETRGLEVGERFDRLSEIKQRDTEGWGEPIQHETGLLEASFSASWSRRGTVCIRQNYPLPVTVLSIMPEVELGG